MVRVVRWNGRDVPEELKDLPAGTYVVEAVDDAPVLTDEQDAGLQRALESLERGRGRSVDEVRATIATALRR